MNHQFLFASFLAISIVSGLLTFLAIPFFRFYKDSRLYVWMLCNFFYSVGSSIVALELIESNGLSPFDFNNKVFLISQILRYYSAIGLMLFMRSFSQKSFFQASPFKILLVISLLFGFSIAVIGPHITPEYKGAAVASFWAMFQVIWFIYELNLIQKSGKYPKNYALRSLIALARCLLIVNLYLVLVTVSAFFNLLPLLGLPGLDVQFAVFITRLISSLLSSIGFILAFIFWVEGYSDIAIQSKSDTLRIANLLVEKDLLINNLANTNALVESGALAAGLAHELNQYLARIQLNAEQAICSLNEGRDSSESIKSLQYIAQANQQAAKLILSLKKIFRNPNQEKTLLRLDAVVVEVTELFKERLLKSDIKLDLNLGVTQEVAVIESLMRQVLSNLITNAIESLDGSIQANKRISIELSRSSADVTLKIFDNGPGIQKNKELSLFELFQTSKSGGTGIGLWLSKQIVQSQGGRIYAHSPLTGGIIFVIEIKI
jgi:signal transduction histidine kinase